MYFVTLTAFFISIIYPVAMGKKERRLTTKLTQVKTHFLIEPDYHIPKFIPLVGPNFCTKQKVNNSSEIVESNGKTARGVTIANAIY